MPGTETAAAARRVGIIVLNWRNFEATERCLRSLEVVNEPRCTIYLLDNDSGDGSMERLEADLAGRGIVFLRNPSNLGFAAGCNPGIRRALDDGCDYVLLLNNDCVVIDPGFLLRMVDLAEREPRCGIVGGKILFWPDTRVIWSTGGFIRFWGGETHIGHGEEDRGQYEQVARRSFISGALMLVKREVFERVGLLPEAYFFGKEEWEFSVGALRAGYTLLYHPRARIAHVAGDSHEGTDPAYVYNGTLSRILYKRRNMSRPAYALWWLVHAVYLRFVMPLRYRLNPGLFVRGVPPEMIQAASLAAVRDAARTDKVTLEMLERFRASVAPTPSRS